LGSCLSISLEPAISIQPLQPAAADLGKLLLGLMRSKPGINSSNFTSFASQLYFDSLFFSIGSLPIRG
jgi:hypothetical protein